MPTCGTYVGNIYLTEIDGVSAHYHIFIGNKDYWGKGVAREASHLIIQYAFLTLGLQYVQLRVHKDNAKAIGLYKHIGFEVIDTNGVWLTMRFCKAV